MHFPSNRVEILSVSGVSLLRFILLTSSKRVYIKKNFEENANSEYTTIRFEFGLSSIL